MYSWDVRLVNITDNTIAGERTNIDCLNDAREEAISIMQHCVALFGKDDDDCCAFVHCNCIYADWDIILFQFWEDLTSPTGRKREGRIAVYPVREGWFEQPIEYDRPC